MSESAPPSSVSSSTLPPLAGLRVVELARNVSGPYAGKLLVDAGADVVKLEPPGGDPLRRWTASGTRLPEGEDGALFQYLNASKRSVVVDLETDAGRARLQALVADADVLMEDLGPGGLDAVGLSAAALQAEHPDLSVVSLSDWGGDGPFAGRPASEFTQQAAVGSIAYRGLRDRDPVAAGGRIGEWALGVFAAVGALTSARLARRTGRGSHVDASRFEAMVLCLTVYHDLDGQWNEAPLPRSIEIPSIERAKNGWVGFCTVTGQQWVDLCALMGQPEVAEREEYLAAQKRMDDIDFMKEIIEAWTLDLDVDEILEMCAAIRIPAAPIGNGATLPQMEHLVAREVFRTSPGGFLQPRPPYLIEHSAQRPLGPAPALDAEADATFGPRERPSGAGASGSHGARPLDGLKVVDLTAFWAGPLASSFLADMGADVIKIESAQRPDGMRFAGAVPNAEMWEWSPVFHGANPGKRDLTLNLDDERGLALLKKLIAGADVLIENFSARVLENFGLDWPSAHALNPGLIMVRMPAFGLDGPWRDRPGFAMTVEQMSGLAWMTGYADMPLVPRGSCDPIGGMHTIFALLLALDERERDGRGRLVEVPLVEVAINIAAEQVLEHSAYGQLLEREENRSPLAAPQGLYPCIGSERTPETLAIAVAGDAQWQAWVALMGAPEWARSARFATHADRRRHADELDAHLREWTRTQPLEALQDALHQRGIAAERVVNARRLMPHPQLEHRGFFQTLSHPRTGDTRYPGWPLVWSELPRALHRRPAPTLGEHNREILREELGLSDEEIEALRSDAVIGERPSFM